MASVRVDPVELRIASAHIVAAAAEYAQITSRHRAEFSDGVARWRGDASKQALLETAERWEADHAAHHRRALAVGEGLEDAAQQFAVVDHGAGEAVDRAVSGAGL